jgi:hypothetical protein
LTIHPVQLRDSSEEPSSSSKTFEKIVHHGGRMFHATTVMAAIFSARAQDVIARNDTELVPLLHKDGVELLLISPTTRFAVVNSAVGLGAPRTKRFPRA